MASGTGLHAPKRTFTDGWDVTIAWTVGNADDLTSASLHPVVEHGGVRILLLGLGRRMAAISQELRAVMQQAGIVLEAMDIGAAWRTCNMLVVEDRRVTAAR